MRAHQTAGGRRDPFRGRRHDAMNTGHRHRPAGTVPVRVAAASTKGQPMTILITGAGRGIGRGLIEGYAATGADLIGTHRGGAAPVGPEGVEWQLLDVTAAAGDPAAPDALASRLAGRAVDLLVCNAGIYAARGESLETGFGADVWARSFAVNVTGVFRTVQALLPHLGRAADPRIAIIASRMGSDTLAPGGSYAYRASKAAAINLGRNLAADLRPRGIAVGIYHPGWVRTDMGGTGADIDIADSVTGLMAQFDALTLAGTGCFVAHDGTPIPF